MTTTHVADEIIDSAAIRAFTEEFGDLATAMPPVAIVIAAFNEEGAIGPVVDTLPRAVAGLDTVTIVVSDGSVDATGKEARVAGALVCDVPVNRGQGAALRLGYRLARDGGARYIVTTDADGQYNPAEIESLLAPILADQADFVTGSRKLGSEETKDPVRKLGVRVFALAISVLTGQRISDTTFGLRAMRAEVTAAVRLEQPQYQASELLIGVITHGYRVAERPATIHRRRVGKSKKGNNAFYAMRFAKVVVTTWWRERQRRMRGERGVRSAGRSGSPARPEPLADGAIAKESGPGALAPDRTDDSDAPGLDPRSLKST
ncbi:MAG TPA: glycosyltransferase family 2 protein [Streptosporangiaceae bacterium]|nr:glycosyltransferase family 2 protein [Streptosporangiaceae bacterium]